MKFNVNYMALRNNIINNLTESQLKIGYSENAVTLNFTEDSLHRLMLPAENESIEEAFEQFAQLVSPELGKLTLEPFEGRYALTIPVKGVRFVHEKIKPNPFLVEFITAIKTPFTLNSIEDVLSVFNKYSSRVVCKKVNNSEFQYFLYFADGIPDDFIYCIDTNFGTISYHRFTQDDFLSMGYIL